MAFGRGRALRAAAMAVGAVTMLGVLVGLAMPTAAMADGRPNSGGATYSVKVTLTGNGVGSGGSLGVPGSGGYTVSIPTLCGYSTSSWTQADMEQQWRTDRQLIDTLKANKTLPTNGVPTDAQVKAWILKQAAADDKGDGIGYENYMWLTGVVANWGRSGIWYIDGCTGTQSDKYFNDFAHNNPPVLSGAGNPPVPNNPPIRPGVLIRAAEAAMTLPHVQSVAFNPRGRSYVQLPTYVWANESERGLAPGEVKSVTASVQAGGPRQYATVTATYRSTTFTSSLQTTGCQAPDVRRAAGYAQGSASVCRIFTQSSSRVTVTASPQWDTAGRECLPGCRAVGVPRPVGIEGTGALSVAEIQTLDTE